MRHRSWKSRSIRGWRLTSSSLSTSGKPSNAPSLSDTELSSSWIMGRDVLTGLWRKMYCRVEAPKWKRWSNCSCVGFCDSSLSVPMKVPCAAGKIHVWYFFEVVWRIKFRLRLEPIKKKPSSPSSSTLEGRPHHFFLNWLPHSRN